MSSLINKNSTLLITKIEEWREKKSLKEVDFNPVLDSVDEIIQILRNEYSYEPIEDDLIQLPYSFEGSATRDLTYESQVLTWLILDFFYQEVQYDELANGLLHETDQRDHYFEFYGRSFLEILEKKINSAEESLQKKGRSERLLTQYDINVWREWLEENDDLELKERLSKINEVILEMQRNVAVHDLIPGTLNDFITLKDLLIRDQIINSTVQREDFMRHKYFPNGSYRLYEKWMEIYFRPGESGWKTRASLIYRLMTEESLLVCTQDKFKSFIHEYYQEYDLEDTYKFKAIKRNQMVELKSAFKELLNRFKSNKI